jgi:hypothetical protein
MGAFVEDALSFAAWTRVTGRRRQRNNGWRRGMSDRPCAFGADLLNDSVGREIGQEQRGDEHGAEDAQRNVLG